MYSEALEHLVKLARQKLEAMNRHFLRYFAHAMLAGSYVGLAVVLMLSVGAPLFAARSPATTLVMGASFGLALTLVVFAGAELFTGNNMYFTVGALARETTWLDALRNWIVVFAGNLAGALAFAGLIVGSGIFAHVDAGHLLLALAAKKMHLGFGELFFRGILCNWFVCLALWTATKAKSESAKLILLWWMLFGFIASGYEHSVANMTLLSLALWLPHPDTITLAGWFHNLVPVTLGNIAGGGLFVGGAYWFVNGGRSSLSGKA